MPPLDDDAVLLDIELVRRVYRLRWVEYAHVNLQIVELGRPHGRETRVCVAAAIASLITSCASASSVGLIVPMHPRSSPVLAVWIVTNTPAGPPSIGAGVSAGFNLRRSRTYASMVAVGQVERGGDRAKMGP